MKQTLGDVDWVSLLYPLDMNDAWLHFIAIFQDALDTCVSTYNYEPKEKKSSYNNSKALCLKKRIIFGLNSSSCRLCKFQISKQSA